MYYIGIDIGTTKIAGILAAFPSGKVLKVLSQGNDATLAPSSPWENLQDPLRIWEIVQEILATLKAEGRGDVGGIGISSQMHGFLYTGKGGEALSPLFTWQDSRGAQILRDGKSATELILEKTGQVVHSGYALASHYYNSQKGLTPEGPFKIASIGGFLTMKLTGNREPFIDPSEGASFGLYNSAGEDFHRGAIQQLWGEDSFLPETVGFHHCAGKDKEGVAVYQSLGDNQASFLGAVEEPEGTLLINMGTGGQLSFVADPFKITSLPSMEIRPFPQKDLVVGSSLAGGKSFEILVNFFEGTLAFFGQSFTREEVYRRIDEGCREVHESPLEVRPFFNGARGNPKLKGSIHHIDLHNFCPENLIYAFAKAILWELREIFDSNGIEEKMDLKRVVASGNGVKKNPLVKEFIKRLFPGEFSLSEVDEDAAYGAALYTYQSSR